MNPNLQKPLPAAEVDPASRMFMIAYGELRRMAARYFQEEPGGHTLQPTAIVHEAYLRLRADPDPPWTDRRQFLAVAATCMRRILVDHARGRRALKRGGGAHRMNVDSLGVAHEDRDEFVLALDDALDRLTRLDPQQGRVVELRFFAGLSIEESAEVLGVSTRTVNRDWLTAKGWLHRAMHEQP